jgi:hypothetical protein
VLYLLRVAVPDRPGALGALATAIGRAGGDIKAVDVVERGSSIAVDDVLIQATEDVAAAIRAEVSVLPGAAIEAWQPFSAGDQLGGGLDLVDSLGFGASRVRAAIIRIAPAVLRTSWVVIVEAIENGVAVTQASANAPWSRWTSLPWFPLAAPARIDADPSWLPHAWGPEPELAGAPIADSASVLLAVRPSGPMFRRSEIDRLAGLAAIAALASDPAPSGSWVGGTRSR